ncbi:MAG TPA: hypothetical protein VK501_21965 [Baekduia sp.]|uniref:hypothetical protein n=1 Tax=Baekduia sp. TaxID=2600305 RepID=UPI002C88F283|nr:hypothetical protein [Baekduia sp.]HMJ36586.1 hypothetical protein [Baekduia sp.]
MIRRLGHRVGVYLGLREDPELQRAWQTAEADPAVLIVVWGLPAVALVIGLGLLLWHLSSTFSPVRLAVRVAEGIAFAVLLAEVFARWVPAVRRAMSGAGDADDDAPDSHGG